MKKLTIISIVLLFVSSLSAQMVGNNVKFRSADGEKFSLFISGRKINSEPAAEVELNKVFVDALNVKVVFEADPSDTLSQNQLPIMKEQQGDVPCPFQTIYKIEKAKKNKKNISKYRFVLVKMECIYAKPKRYQLSK